jgi:hypothetical protein
LRAQSNVALAGESICSRESDRRTLSPYSRVLSRSDAVTVKEELGEQTIRTISRRKRHAGDFLQRWDDDHRRFCTGEGRFHTNHRSSECGWSNLLRSLPERKHKVHVLERSRCADSVIALNPVLVGAYCRFLRNTAAPLNPRPERTKRSLEFVLIGWKPACRTFIDSSDAATTNNS